MTQPAIGLGCNPALINVYIGNIPAQPEYQHIDSVSPVTHGEIHAIGQNLGNGWRKVFNVYGKFLFALNPASFKFSAQYKSWQQFRDNQLLQPNSETSLLFSAPSADNGVYHIIMGRTYAKKLINEGKLQSQLTWLDHEFAIDTQKKLVVCPYFDYRQLNNEKINRLASIIEDF